MPPVDSLPTPPSNLVFLPGQIIFPAQNIAKDCNSYLQQLLLRSGIEENLIGAGGIEELRRRKLRLLDQFRGESLLGSLYTPEGYSLDGAFFPGVINADKGLYAEKGGPTAIYFNANMQLFESASAHQTVRMYVSAGVNVLLFNYRGVGESEGALTRDGVLVDGDAVVQFVKCVHGVPEHHIICHARSIGGGIANVVARLHPRVSLANERSFSSLLQVIRIVVHKFLGVPLPDSPPGHRGGSMQEAGKGGDSGSGSSGLHAGYCGCHEALRRCLAWSVTGLAGGIGWDFEASENWSKVRGSKWLLYHPRDAVIPMEASLYHAVVKEGCTVQALRMPGEEDGHNRPLSAEEKEWHMGMVAEALRSPPPPMGLHEASRGASRGASIEGLGMDALASDRPAHSTGGSLRQQEALRQGREGLDSVSPLDSIYRPNSRHSTRSSDSDRLSLLAPPPFTIGDGASGDVEMGGHIGGTGGGGSGGTAARPGNRGDG